MMRRAAVILLAALALLGAVVSASGQQAADPLAADTAAAARLAPSLPGARDFVAEVRANFTAEARRYSRTRQALAFVSAGYALLVAALLLFSRLSARMRDIATSVGRYRYFHTFLYVALYAVVAWVLTFPLSYYTGFALEHQFNLSNQSFGEWATDELKGLMITIALLGLVPVAYLAYGALRKSPRRWWLPLSLGTLPLLVLSVVITPVVIEPAFNRFTPLHDQALRQKIVALAEKAGIPGRKVYEVDKSRQTKKFNAYVSGFGETQRIVLWDTTLKGMSEGEILFVMGHEMGHYRLLHIWKGIVFYWVLLSVIYFALNRGLEGLLARFGPRWGFGEIGDLASMPLLLGAVGLVVFLAQPLTNGFSRYIEHEADVFGLEVTQLNEAGAGAFLKLGLQNKSDPEPNPFIRAWLYTHPPLMERVRFALAYRPWERGEPDRLYHAPR